MLILLVVDSNHVQQNDNRGLIASRAPSTPGNSDLDKLFAKFLPATTTSTSNDHGHGIAVPALNSFTAGIPGAAGNDSRSAASMSVQSLFASVTGPQQSQISTQIQPYLGGSGLPPSKLPLTMQQQPGPSTTGLSLLDSIFASAVPPPAAPPSIPLSQAVPQVVAGVGGQSQHVYYQQQQPSIDLSTMGSHPHPLPSTSTTYPLPVPFGASSLSRSLQPQPLQPIPIYSPTPKSLPAPQVLSQNVIGSLLNCGGNSSSGDGRQRQRGGGSVDSEVELESHPSSRDGDNELEELDDGSGGGGGASSEDGGREGRGRSVQMQGQGKGKKGKLDKGGKNVTTTSVGAGLNVISGAANSTVGGDVTPRPGFLVGDNLKNLIIPSGAAATTSSTTTAVATVSAGAPPSVPTQKQKQKQRQKSKPRHGRPLVPFESSSVLWPYPPSQEHDMSISDDHHDDELISESGNESSSTSLSRGGEGEEGEEAILGGDIVELDWEDISALSDLKEFERVQREQQRQQERQQRKKKNEGKGNVVDTTNEQEEGLESIVGGEGRRRRKKKKNAKNKQERLEARAKEREEIENSWDFPVVTNLDSGVGSVADYGVVTNGGAIDMNGTGPGPGTETMNLNGKMVLIPKIFSDDSPPASPSPVPSPLAPLSPVRRQSLSPRVVLRKSDDDDDDDDIDDDDGGSEDEYECEDQSVVPARRRSLSPSPSQEREREVEVILSGNGSTKKKKKNRRTLGTKAKKGGGGGGVSSSLAPAVGDDTSVVSLLPAPATGDGSVDDTCQVKSEAMMDEERMTTSLLNVMRGEGIGSFERASPSANGKDAFVQELKRLMESEKFMNELWMGYSKSGEGGHGGNDNDDNDDSNTS